MKNSNTNHILNRLTYGIKPSDLETINQIGTEQFIKNQLHPESIDDKETTTELQPILNDLLCKSPQELYERKKLSDWGDKRLAFEQTRNATFYRRINSKKQLFEKTVQFWHEHFSINADKNQETFLLFPDYDRQIRSNAFGNFSNLLKSVIQHPCMIIYLDNQNSTNAGPNENLARELLELHTLGAINYQTENGYIDDDVYEVSRCLTGWSVEYNLEEPDRGTFKYKHNHHDRFQKQVLGTAINRDQAPLVDGETVLDLVAKHPGTAKHIALKFCHYFVSDQPTDDLVQSTANVFLNNKDNPNQIQITLGHLFSTDEFLKSENEKFKRPQDWIVSAMRASEAKYDPQNRNFHLNYILSIMGHPLFVYRTPEGPSFENEKWINTNGMIWRWRAISEIAFNWFQKKGIHFDAYETMQASNQTLETAHQITDFWIKRIFNKEVSLETKQALADFISLNRNPDLPLHENEVKENIQQLVALCLVAPEFLRS